MENVIPFIAYSTTTILSILINSANLTNLDKIEVLEEIYYSKYDRERSLDEFLEKYLAAYYIVEDIPVKFRQLLKNTSSFSVYNSTVWKLNADEFKLEATETINYYLNIIIEEGIKKPKNQIDFLRMIESQLGIVNQFSLPDLKPYFVNALVNYHIENSVSVDGFQRLLNFYSDRKEKKTFFDLESVSKVLSNRYDTKIMKFKLAFLLHQKSHKDYLDTIMNYNFINNNNDFFEQNKFLEEYIKMNTQDYLTTVFVDTFDNSFYCKIMNYYDFKNEEKALEIINNTKSYFLFFDNCDSKHLNKLLYPDIFQFCESHSGFLTGVLFLFLYECWGILFYFRNRNTVDDPLHADGSPTESSSNTENPENKNENQAVGPAVSSTTAEASPNIVNNSPETVSSATTNPSADEKSENVAARPDEKSENVAARPNEKSENVAARPNDDAPVDPVSSSASNVPVRRSNKSAEDFASLLAFKEEYTKELKPRTWVSSGFIGSYLKLFFKHEIDYIQILFVELTPNNQLPADLKTFILSDSDNVIVAEESVLIILLCHEHHFSVYLVQNYLGVQNSTINVDGKCHIYHFDSIKGKHSATPFLPFLDLFEKLRVIVSDTEHQYNYDYHTVNIPQQNNSYDCGIYAVWYLEQIVKYFEQHGYDPEERHYENAFASFFRDKRIDVNECRKRYFEEVFKTRD